MPEATGDKTIGDIVAADFRAASVFARYGIDFCCGGQVTLAAVCAERSLNLPAITQELAAVQSAPADRSQNYAAWSLPFLADYIVNTHHAYLKENDPQIAAYARKIAAVHGANHPELLEIAAIFEQIATDMSVHLQEEEEVFFPALKRVNDAKIDGQTADPKDQETIRTSLRKLQSEHEAIGDAIHKIHHLTRNYTIPDDVCNTFTLTYQKLKEFEDDLHKHVHLENNILFAKAEKL
jgi:regulator of cell morphogenesis and NO signaling